jgi:hypothetical protein|tara:strand:+ start:6048 stop:7115 length:1068 start_codon:yes stop_codon:yes gene_type:complete
MAISDSQKVDLLWKKVGFSKAKTDTNANKKAPNESIVSEAIIRPSQIWNQSASIPVVIPSSSSSLVTVYSDALSNTVECVEDSTASNNRTWKAGSTNWIPPLFGATYQLKVYASTASDSTPQTNGTQLFETGSGSEDQWFFDYQSGTLNFIGDNLPTDIGTGTSNVIYISGARYSGAVGLSDSAATQTYRKASLSAVYSDSAIVTGDIIEVADNGDGEYAVYLAKQDNPTSTGHLTLISSKDSAGSDAATLSASIHESSGTVALGDLSATSRPLSVVLDVTTAFDGTGYAISVGDDNDNERLMTNAYVDLGETITFITNPSYVYMNALDADNTIKVYVTAGTATQGNATVLVSYM